MASSPQRLPVPPRPQCAYHSVNGEGRWRLRSESNRRPRLCRPLHNHSATQPRSKELERETGFEPATLTLARLRSTN